MVTFRNHEFVSAGSVDIGIACLFSLFVRMGLDLSAESINPLIMLLAATRSDDEGHQLGVSR